MARQLVTVLSFALILSLTKGCTAATSDMGSMAAAAAGVPQIPAFLPMKHSVAATPALAIDGIWRISSNGKRIRLEAGRAYAVDPWVHAFTLKISPDMVVMKNFQRSDNGKYTAEDLPLMATNTLSLQPTGQLAVVAQTFFGPIPFKLLPVGLDSPDKFNREMQAAGFASIAVPISGLGDSTEEDLGEPGSDDYEDEYEDDEGDEYDEYD